MHPAQHCTVLLFGLTVAQVLTSPAWNQTPRDLQVVELWAGVGHVAAAAKEQGLRAATFEKDHDELQNFLHQPGFMAAVALVMRLSPGGLLAMGPTCSTFVFANSNNNKRSESNSWAGDPEYEPTHTGNLEAEAAWFFFCLAAARGVEAFIENPTGSHIFKYIRCREGLQHLKDRVPSLGELKNQYRCAYSEEPNGQRIKKGFRFVATGPWIQSVLRKCPCGNELHRLCMRTDKKGKVTGNRDILKESQSYPLELGRALVQAWLARAQPVPATAAVPAAAPAVSAVPAVPAVPAGPAQHSRPARASDLPDLPFGQKRTASASQAVPARASDLPDLPFGQKWTSSASQAQPPRKKANTSSSVPDCPFGC